MGPALVAATGATIPDLITFIVAAGFVLVGAIGVVTSRNTVHAALSLVLTLFGIAVLFVEQHADFLAAVQVIVYAGAIVVLFLFVIMFLGVDRLENIETEPLRGQRPLAFLLIAIALGGIIALFVNAHWVTGARSATGSTTGGGHTNVYLLGKSVFTTYLFAFEATAALLVIAVVGAVVLARRPSGGVLDEPGDDEESAGTEVGEGAGPGAQGAEGVTLEPAGGAAEHGEGAR
ncbi:MAG: NADH-quinone oxidoreductase subunit J [Acidimicrobiales bacterium]